ncbi:DUF4178 domain-containing protein [bacterium]|nr:DUF4178 domain-containing protein [bacterium]
MTRLKAPCPACAAPVEFKSRESLVTICEFCRSIIARGDKQLQDHGKVADLVNTESPLSIGLKGRFRGKPFRIVGRVQYHHSAGGVWDEWYAEFSNGKLGWLAEAQGRFYFTFRKKPKSGSAFPAIESLHPGEKVPLSETEFTVAEVGIAAAAGAEGEIPWDLKPETKHRFVDLYGPDGQFATLEYGTDPAGHLGWQVSLDEIGLAGLKPAHKQTKQVTAKQVNCPQCAGTLDLRAPDETQRVSCPFCNALLDCDSGNLKYLSTLTSPVNPLIPLGTEGRIDDVDYAVIGFMQRSVTFDRKYYWTEYLLYQPDAGFRWLINSDNHWSFAEPVSPAEVHDFKNAVRWNGQTFKLFQRAIARVEYVLGEFYWKVKIDEEVGCRDLICPPYSISVERTMAVAPQSDGEPGDKLRMNLGEVNYTLARYLPHADVESAFGVSGLPRAWGVAPNQPAPCDKAVFGYWATFAAAMVAIYYIASRFISQQADPWLLAWGLFLVSVIPVGGLIFNLIFDVNRWSDSDFSPYSTG